MTSPADTEQIRRVADAVAEMALEKFATAHPEIRKEAQIPAPLKWAAGIVGGVFTAVTIAAVIWGVTSLSTVLITLGTIEQRLDNMESQISAGTADRYTATQAIAHEREMNRRVTRLEAAHGLE